MNIPVRLRHEPRRQAAGPPQLGPQIVRAVAREPAAGCRQLERVARPNAREEAIISPVPGGEQRQTEPIRTTHAGLSEEDSRAGGSRGKYSRKMVSSVTSVTPSGTIVPLRNNCVPYAACW